jgi:hypothetical protein
MTGFHVVLDGDGHLVSEGETVAEFRDRFDRDPEGGVVVLEEDGTPWRCLYPDYEIREDADPSTQAYLLDELGDDHYIGNQIREDLQSERSE